ncbi:hypothetical protein A1O3_09544 [Capronia epimyces CBS 606.96]|uniref:AB hydrolase-1 domain-containing protein n=1 Tax=Capronia epimyces CBS 606.96 TaxID=1182542 RepID=W9XAP9_9EURO|nr:uncharacterized protein A1O3_09544 [Capronia epimyces CBS 606.96]EXJ77318.1 hypothetical protein A1O3_09544 [Capronia epimyces CBS 606.96]
MAAKPPPPPLPPRATSNFRSRSDKDQSSYLSPNSQSSGESPYLAGFHDPRSSSTQSLGPVKSASDERRTLLIVYIHGFLGDETSFKSFPAHVHGLLTPALAPTHVVYTKIYPRYRSRENIAVARNALSNWLAAHESDSTDIILVGHSLGGILAAEVVLIPSNDPGSHLFQHQILGLIAFDTPFLGMHPGVIGTGIASLFRTPPQIKESAVPGASLNLDLFSAPQDATYNPSYQNDVHLANRKGKLQKAWYFWNKHAGELAKATRSYVSSHLEFGGCLADYPGLIKRYRAIRALEDVEETMKRRAPNGRLLKRVRFVNYYSASTGPVKEKPPDILEVAATEETSSVGHTHSSLGATDSSPQLSLEEHRNIQDLTRDVADLKVDHGPPNVSMLPSTGENTPPPGAETKHGEGLGTSSEMARQPPLPSPELCDDTGTLRTLSMEDLGIDKVFQDGVTDKDISVQQETEDIHEERGSTHLQTDQLEHPTQMSAKKDDEPMNDEENTDKADTQKKPKDRKFCALPTRNRQTGERDHTWIRVHMEGIDEVVAHTSLFNIGETYSKLVGDTVERIGKWVAEDASRRLILAEMDTDTWDS